jgi:hypothetical protein
MLSFPRVVDPEWSASLKSFKAMPSRGRTLAAAQVPTVVGTLARAALLAACGDKKEQPASQVAAQVLRN